MGQASLAYLAKAIVVICCLALGSFQAAPAFANAKYAGIVIDAKSGKTLYTSNATSRRYPASLTKIMTLYVLFEEVERGRYSLESRLKVSTFAAAQAPSKLGLKAGSTIRVRDAIRALAVKSANDVAVVVAENVSGSETAFARRMTSTARSLGMKQTTFKNASGLPNSKQVTTAKDMALLGRAIQDRFPAYYKYFSTRSFTWGKRKYSNTNRLLGRVSGVDGIKTGYTRASGFNLVTSVKRNDRHIIAVVMGGRTSKRRNAHMEDLIRRYLNKAKTGKRTAPMIMGTTGYNIPPFPKPRPQIEPPTNSIVAARDPVDTEQDPAAVPGPLAAQSIPDPIAPLTDGSPAQDRISERINTASQTAIMAYRAGTLADRDALSDFVSEQGNEPDSGPGSEQGSQSIPSSDDKMTPESGWFIQIAAVPTRSGAQAILDETRHKAGKLLADAKPMTQKVNKGKRTYFRARFAGFVDKHEARRVCKSLKDIDVTCLAVPR